MRAACLLGVTLAEDIASNRINQNTAYARVGRGDPEGFLGERKGLLGVGWGNVANLSKNQIPEAVQFTVSVALQTRTRPVFATLMRRVCAKSSVPDRSLRAMSMFRLPSAPLTSLA